MKKGEGRRVRATVTRLRAWLHSVQARCALVVTIGTLVLCALFCLASAPQHYDLKVGSISQATISATRDVVDEVTTEERRKAAAASVEPTYHLQEGAADEVMNSLRAVFAELRSVQLYGLTLRPGDLPEDELRSLTFTDEQIANAQSLVTTMTLTRYQATTLLRTTTADLDTMESTVSIAV